MNKNALMLSLLVVLFLSVVSVEGALRPAARAAGFHNVTYTDSIQSVDDSPSLNYIRVLPQTFVIGWGVAGGSLNFVGDASGNYVVNAAGSLLTFSDSVSGYNLRVNGYGPVIDAAGYWVGRNIDSSRITINTTNNVFARSGTCPSGQVVMNTSSSGVQCVALPTGSGSTGSCPANQYVVRTTSSGVVCAPIDAANVTGDVVAGSCPVNQYVVRTTSTGVVCSGVTSSNVTGEAVPGSCPVGQVVMNTTASGVQCVALPSAGLPNPWFTSGSNVYYTGGNVGIGTSSPSFTLDVSGTIRSTGSLNASSIYTPGSVTAGSIVAGPTSVASLSVTNQKICYASSTNSFVNSVAVPVAPSWSATDCRAYSILLFTNSGYHSLGCTSSTGTPKSTVTVFKSNLAAVLASEIGGSASCGWTAEPVTMLINNVHSTGQCTAAGGTVVSVSGGSICRFNTTCPSGWSQYLSWSTTSSVFCNAYVAPACSWMASQAESCTTDSHAWSNTAVEECFPKSVEDMSPGGGCTVEPYTCWAATTQRGCY